MTDGPLHPRAVFVAWRDPREHRCYPIGRLARISPASAPLSPGGPHLRYEFVYVRGVHEATRVGFRPIPSFDRFDTVYLSERLFPLFANRLLGEGRGEYPSLLERLMLSTSPGDPLEILSRTGGIRTTDSYETFPLPRLDRTLPGFRTHFLVHALRHFPETSHQRIACLTVGEPLRLMPDCQNEVDPDAIALRTKDRILVGHIPNYLLMEVWKLHRWCEYVDVRVAKVSPPPAPLDQRLLCRLEACWPADYLPFVDDRFEPIPRDASPTAVLSGLADEQLEGILSR